jgi:hypothetical protein
MAKSLKQKREEDMKMYSKKLEIARETIMQFHDDTEIKKALAAYIKRTERALEVCKLDPIAADRIYHDIKT